MRIKSSKAYKTYDPNKANFIQCIYQACLALIEYGEKDFTCPRFIESPNYNDDYSVILIFKVHTDSSTESKMILITEYKSPAQIHQIVSAALLDSNFRKKNKDKKRTAVSGSSFLNVSQVRTKCPLWE